MKERLFVNAIERRVRRIDAYQQRHALLAFPFAVMQKYGNDQASGKAIVIAYYALFALFPLLLLFTTILGFILGGHTTFRHQVLNSALANVPVIGGSLRSHDHPLTGSFLGITLGIIGLVYGTQGLGQALLNAMYTVWNTPYVRWPNFWLRRLRGFAILAVLGLTILASTALVSFAPAIFSGSLVRIWSVAVSVVANFSVFMAAFVLLTSESLGWRDVILGAAIATGFWEGLQAVGGAYIHYILAHVVNLYSFFAIVIGLLSWLFVSAQLTLLAAEINVVRKYKLWPRSITQPPLTDGDRRVFIRLAVMEVRRPEVKVSVGFYPTANRQPLDEAVAKKKLKD